LSGTVAASSASSGSLETTSSVRLSGTSSSSASVSGAVVVVRGLLGSAATNSTASGLLSAHRTLTAEAAVIGSASGSLTVGSPSARPEDLRQVAFLRKVRRTLNKQRSRHSRVRLRE
jgi:hypothetical protein